jgi:hypothetical protein
MSLHAAQSRETRIGNGKSPSKMLGILLMIGCVGYLIQSFAAFLLPNLEVNIALFTFWGEVLFPLWLVIKSAPLWNTRFSRSGAVSAQIRDHHHSLAHLW